MSNARRLRRHNHRHVPTVDRTTLEVIAGASSARRGCTCDPWLRLRHLDGLPWVTVCHDDDCPAIAEVAP